MLSDKQIQEIRARVEKATRGPYRISNLSGDIGCDFDSDGYVQLARRPERSGGKKQIQVDADMELFANSWQDITDLLAENEELRQDVKSLTDFVAKAVIEVLKNKMTKQQGKVKGGDNKCDF